MAVPFSKKSKPFKKKGYKQKRYLKKHHLNYTTRREILLQTVFKQ
jgi:hypothetical protein